MTFFKDTIIICVQLKEDLVWFLFSPLFAVVLRQGLLYPRLILTQCCN